jgi:hypothetical protein
MGAIDVEAGIAQCRRNLRCGLDIIFNYQHPGHASSPKDLVPFCHIESKAPIYHT